MLVEMQIRNEPITYRARATPITPFDVNVIRGIADG